MFRSQLGNGVVDFNRYTWAVFNVWVNPTTFTPQLACEWLSEWGGGTWFVWTPLSVIVEWWGYWFMLLKVSLIIKCDPLPLFYTHAHPHKHAHTHHSFIPLPLMLSFDSVCRWVSERRTTPSVCEMYPATIHPHTPKHAHKKKIFFLISSPKASIITNTSQTFSYKVRLLSLLCLCSSMSFVRVVNVLLRLYLCI